MMKKILFFISIMIFGCSNFNGRSFKFTYEMDIKPSNGKKIELWIPYPQSNKVQHISNIKIDSKLEYEIKNEARHGNKYIYIYSNEGTYELTKIIMTFDVDRSEHQNQLYEKINPQSYLGAYSRVPTGKIFEGIINKNKLSKNDMRGVYDFVLSGMHYGKPTSVDNKYYKDPWLHGGEVYGMKGVTRDQVVELYQKAKDENSDYTFGNGNSIYACDIGVGNCTDYHSYFISLNRTLKVPARFHMGFSIPQTDEGTIEGYHCWADYFIDGEGWYPVDISEADKNPDKKDYFFGTVNEHRVDMMIGRDFVLDEYNNGVVNLFIYPLLEIDDESSLDFTKRFSYQNLN